MDTLLSAVQSTVKGILKKCGDPRRELEGELFCNVPEHHDLVSQTQLITLTRTRCNHPHSYTLKKDKGQLRIQYRTAKLISQLITLSYEGPVQQCKFTTGDKRQW